MDDIDKLPPLAAYQAYLKRGELAYQFSPDEGVAVFYPRLASPGSGRTNLEWRVSKGLGAVYAVTTVRPRDAAPYNVSIIAIDEGYRMMSRVEDVAPEDVKIGMRVRVRMHADGKNPVYPVFVPAEDAR